MSSSCGWAWWWRGAILGTLLGWITLVTFVDACPERCSCKWKGGKEWVECANRSLIGLPQGAREETQVLDLSSNHLVHLPAQCFRALGLTNLQRLYLSKSHISQVAPAALDGLSGLVELDLAGNQIKDVPSDTFESCPGLMRLILNDNPIREIRRKAFHPLVQLTNLELSQCQLVNIEEGAFNGLHSLEWLRLDGNMLTHVPDMTLPLGGNLHGLTLHNNPWLCSCLLRPMQSWLTESAPAAPQESDPVCKAPARLQGRTIKTVKLNDLACLPEISLKERVDMDEGANVTLRCDVYAVPIAKVTWWFNGDLCKPQNENDSFAASTATYVRYIHKERDQKNITSILYVYGIEKSDEGTYTCMAENTAGSVESNLSLRVRFQEKSTPEPPFDHPGTGYVAAVAAGALVGTLLALGCVIGSVLFCTKRRRDQKRNAKSLVSQSKVVTPLSKDVCATLPRKSVNNGGGNGVGIGVGGIVGIGGGVGGGGGGGGSLCFDQQQQQQQQVMYNDRDIIGRTASLERRVTMERSYPVPKYLTEPDLINEVTESGLNVASGTGDSYGIYHQHQLGVSMGGVGIGEHQQRQSHLHHQQQQQQQHQQQSSQVLDYETTRYQMQSDNRPSLSQLSYLDQDGYPLNFGLPKIPFNSSSTLPRLRQRITEGSAAAPPARYTREAEFLARTNPYEPVLSRNDTRYTAEGYPYPIHQSVVKQQATPTVQSIQLPISPVSSASIPEVPFIPSPPAAYRGEPTPLSPRSLMSKTAREAAAAVAARAEGARPPDHPESPDEGYVGDAMDV